MQLKTKAVEAIFYMELSGMIEKKIIRKKYRDSLKVEVDDIVIEHCDIYLEAIDQVESESEMKQHYALANYLLAGMLVRAIKLVAKKYHVAILHDFITYGLELAIEHGDFMRFASRAQDDNITAIDFKKLMKDVDEERAKEKVQEEKFDA